MEYGVEDRNPLPPYEAKVSVLFPIPFTSHGIVEGVSPGPDACEDAKGRQAAKTETLKERNPV